jgi:hypothetical protein
MGDATGLVVGLIFGTVGLAYCMYGKKRADLAIFLAGILLMGLPYVIDNNIVLIVLSIIIMVVPKYVKL